MLSIQPNTASATDTLARRLRQAKPCPRTRRLVLTEADYLMFEVIDRHGPLPTGYLYAFTCHLRRDFSHLQNRLTELYNGDLAGRKLGGWLARPPQQFANFEARYQHLVHSLTPRALAELGERERFSRFSCARGHFVHQLMTACVGASLELAARAQGNRYIPREEIFAHANCLAAKQSARPLAIPLGGADRNAIIPDDLFGYQYADGRYRFFAMEIDRHTESIVRSGDMRGTISAKVAAYQEILGRMLYREWWGVPNLTVLTVTTSRRHADNMLQHLCGNGAHADRFAFAVLSSFGADWRVPKAPFLHLLSDPWMTASGERNIGRP